MKIFGIDPAPVKNSIVFDGKKFREFSPYDLKRFINKVEYLYEDIFIAWDAPLSAAISSANFNLYERKIEKFFNRNAKNRRSFSIPKGISTLGYACCSHWTISQYIFGYPVLNNKISVNHSFNLISDSYDVNYNHSKQITEIHPALSMWIVLKDKLKTNSLFQDSWQYKGVDTKDKLNYKRRKIIIDSLAEISFVSDEIDISWIKEELYESDDKLDTFFCWLLAKKLILKRNDVKIYGDIINGSFLLPFDDTIQRDFLEYLK